MVFAASEREAGFRALYRHAYRPLLAYSLRRYADRAEAEDIVSETFLVAWRRFDEVPLGVELPWLYGVARNVGRNRIRGHRRQDQLIDRLGVNYDAASADPASAGAVELREALATLSEDDQEVLRLVAWEGLSHAEVGVVLDCSANAVAIRMHRARGRLAAALGEDFGKDGRVVGHSSSKAAAVAQPVRTRS